MKIVCYANLNGLDYEYIVCENVNEDYAEIIHDHLSEIKDGRTFYIEDDNYEIGDNW